MSAWPEIEVR